MEAKLIKDLSGEYEVAPETISDISISFGKVVAQQPPAQDGEEGEVTEGGDSVPQGQAVSDISLNGAQVASLINIINAVAAGALSKEGAVSVITAAFPTISREQAISIVAGIQEGNIIPTTKEERQAADKDQGEQGSGGNSNPTKPTSPQTPGGETQKKNSLEVLENLNADELKMLIAGMMGGIELGKYDGIDFTPPEGAREAAKRALDVREKKPASQKGMTAVGLARARDLIKGVKLSPDTVRRMKAFFDRHEVDKKGSTWDEKGKGWQAWNGWGGDSGYAWARKVVGQMEARDKEKELARPGPKSAASTPAPPKERIKGSKQNPEGTAATRSKAGDIEVSEQNEETLKNKIAEFKDKHPNRKAPTLGTLKKVFRRGAGAFSTSFRPTITGGKPNTRNAWAMARVNKFLKMAGGGEVKESYRKADGDLL
jgi:hypothetical protein